jgi:hypothetical protein
MQHERALRDVDLVLLRVAIHCLCNAQEHVVSPRDIGINADALGVRREIGISGESHASRSA